MSKKEIQSLPPSFQARLKEKYPDRFQKIIEEFDQTPNSFLRLNPKKLNLCPFPATKVIWDDQVYMLDQRPVYVIDPLFHAGAYYPQEGSSTLLKVAFDEIKKEHKNSLIIVDLCAAPGGKSTHLLSLMENEDVLLSNEIVHKRYPILKENLTKWGQSNVILTKVDPYYLGKLEAVADIILVDAPCSGEGLFRKQHEWREKWDESQGNHCAQRQMKILDAAHKMLKPNGYLIYSTCTMHESENMDQVSRLCQEYNYSTKQMSALNDLHVDEIINKKEVGYQCVVDRFQGEPFFIALLQKHGTPNRQKEKNRNCPKYLNHSEIPFLNTSKNYWKIKNQIIEANENLYHLAKTLDKEKIYHEYMAVAELFKDKIQPTHFCSMSTSYQNIKILELTLDDALSYLRGEMANIAPQSTSSSAWVLASFRGITIGWLKQVGNRFNNKYPKEYRLRKR